MSAVFSTGGPLPVLTTAARSSSGRIYSEERILGERKKRRKDNFFLSNDQERKGELRIEQHNCSPRVD